MKKSLAFLLAVLTVLAAVPVFGFTATAAASAEDGPAYIIYRQDFEGVSTSRDTKGIWSDLGWYIPAGHSDTGMANYSIVDGALRVDTTRYPVGLGEEDSVLTVFGGDVMSVLREGDFSLSYDLTYREGTVNADGYAAFIYDYNEKSGLVIGEETGEAYGLVALRPNGTGANKLYYPVHSASAWLDLEDRMNASEYVLSNRYTAAGPYPSVYARLFSVEEEPDTVRKGLLDMVGKTVTVRIDYNYASGVCVYMDAHNGAGEILVSATSTKDYDAESNADTWAHFLSRNDGAAIGLVVKPGIVADIDNVSITAETYAEASWNDNVPDLVITEINAGGMSGYGWAEYIEICNPTNKIIDLCDYSIMYSENVEEAGVTGTLSGSNHIKFKAYTKLDDLLGKKLRSYNQFYVSESQLAGMREHEQFEYYDNNKYTANKTQDPNGTYRRIYYVESWNERYQPGAISSAQNTTLLPGECAVLYIIEDTTSKPQCWTTGVNAGHNSSVQISSELSFRNLYAQYGLPTTTKVIAVDTYVTNNVRWSLFDSVNRYYYIGRSYDEGGAEIDYRKHYVTDLTGVVSYAQYTTPIAAGKRYEGVDPENSDFGRAGLADTGYSVHYVYGVDASSDYRRATIYAGHESVSSLKNVGLPMGYQQVIFENLVNKRGGAMSPLSITEIVPRTETLTGQELNAFSAIEITNTSAATVDLYRYSLVRTSLGNACRYVAPDAITPNQFNRATTMKTGNPVTRGASNGAYYYFIEDHVSNPETCTLAPGETVVVWFLTTDTYTAYSGDDDFGFDYFRQYWLNHGCEQLAVLNAAGEYSIKVIAVDAHEGTVFNADNASRVFEISDTASAIYGIALDTSVGETGITPFAAVTTIAPVIPISLYYTLEPQWISPIGSSTTYWANVLTYSRLPVNKSIHYIAGMGQPTGCSMMSDSLKVGCYTYVSGNADKRERGAENMSLKIVMTTSSPLKTPDLGKLKGKEVYALDRSALFLTVRDDAGNPTYYYYDSVRDGGVRTLSGAALTTTGNACLRFDTIVSTVFYDAMAAAYSGKLRVGVLVAGAADAAKLAARAKGDASRSAVETQLRSDGVTFRNVEATSIARTAGSAVLGAYCPVAASAYGTSYVAISYLEVTLPNGRTKTFWSSAQATASAKDVAAKCLADVVSTPSAEYPYARTGVAGRYSPYTAEAQAILTTYTGH